MHNHSLRFVLIMNPYSSWDVNIDQFPRQRYDNFKCTGTETSLSQCVSDGPYPYKCYSEGYAGVTCQSYGIKYYSYFNDKNYHKTLAMTI